MRKMKKTSKTLLGLSLALMAVLFPIVPGLHTTLTAQQRAPRERIAEGTVVGKDDKPITGAIVYLKDTKSNSVKSYIADDAGHVRFGELSQDIDYEIWAELNGKRSKTKGISSFDSQSDFHFTLRIDEGTYRRQKTAVK